MNGSPSPQSFSSPLVPFHREVLPNGVTLLVKENPSVPLVAVDLWVSTGTADESPEQAGISHFLEHLFFKGTLKRPVGVMDREIKSLGGYNNAATSYDFTHYYVVLPSEHTRLALDILTDALLHMELPPAEIERERMVILEEIARRDDSPLGKLYDDFIERIFAGTSYAKPILGTEETLAGMKRDDFLEYRDRHYSADRLHVAVSGDVNPSDVREWTEELLLELRPAENGDSPVENPASDGTMEFEICKDVQQTYCLLGMRTPGIQGTKEEVALDLISAVLGEGRSSRLVSRLVEQTGLCSSVSAFFWSLNRVGLFGVEACYARDSEKEVLGIVREELDRIRTEPPAAPEWEKVKTIMLTSYTYALERNAAMSGTLGRNSASGHLDAAVEYPGRVAEMTPEEAMESLNRCCPEGQQVLGFVRPTQKP